MRLGNDIVDLKVDAEIHPRFLSRILHPVEKTLYPGLSEARFIWVIWAAKEAAFKAHRQGPDPVGFLIPRQWLVDLQLNKVFFGDEEYWITFESNSEYVMATACSENKTFRSQVISSESELNHAQQISLAQSLRNGLFEEFDLEKDKGGIPILRVKGQRRPYSLTHHGRHLAIAYC